MSRSLKAVRKGTDVIKQQSGNAIAARKNDLRQIELAHKDEEKKIISFIDKADQRTQTICDAKGNNIELVKMEPLCPGQMTDKFQMMQINTKMTNGTDLQPLVACFDKKSGVCLPHVTNVLSVDSRPLHILGMPKDIVRERIIRNCQQLYNQGVNVSAICDVETILQEAKDNNKCIDEPKAFWDTTLVAQGCLFQSETMALETVYNALDLGSVLMDLTSSIVTSTKSMACDYFEVNLRHASALGTVKMIGHESVDTPISLSFPIRPRNPSMALAVLSIINYARKNRLHYITRPMIIFPRSEHMIHWQRCAFMPKYLAERINKQVPLANFTVIDDETLRGDDYSITICSCVSDEGKIVVFPIMNLHGFESEMFRVIDRLGGAMASNVILSIRNTLVSMLVLIVQNNGCTNHSPVVCSINDSELQIIAYLSVNCEEPYEKPEVSSSMSLAERQQQITQSWDILEPFKPVIKVLAPIGTVGGVSHVVPQNGFNNNPRVLIGEDGSSFVEYKHTDIQPAIKG